eukprot:5166220-Pyramimonas_sp.AAC.2
MTDRRFSLEAAVLRQPLKEVSIKWVKSEQVLADFFDEGASSRLREESAITTRTDASWTREGSSQQGGQRPEREDG